MVVNLTPHPCGGVSHGPIHLSEAASTQHDAPTQKVTAKPKRKAKTQEVAN